MILKRLIQTNLTCQVTHVAPYSLDMITTRRATDAPLRDETKPAKLLSFSSTISPLLAGSPTYTHDVLNARPS